jgi:hypothetical protein
MQLCSMSKNSRKTLATYIMLSVIGVGLIVFGVYALNEWLHQTEIASQNLDFMVGGPISILAGIAMTVAGIQLSRDLLKKKEKT